MSSLRERRKTKILKVVKNAKLRYINIKNSPFGRKWGKEEEKVVEFNNKEQPVSKKKETDRGKSSDAD